MRIVAAICPKLVRIITCKTKHQDLREDLTEDLHLKVAKLASIAIKKVIWPETVLIQK
jgi:hypothetical protein